MAVYGKVEGKRRGGACEQGAKVVSGSGGSVMDGFPAALKITKLTEEVMKHGL